MRDLPRALLAPGGLASTAVLALQRRPDLVDTLVCWNGRFDALAGDRRRVGVPVLLLVRDDDPGLVRENRLLRDLISEDVALDFIFEPAGSVTESDVVSHKARRWMMRTFRRAPSPVPAHEEDAKGATEEMIERIDVIDGYESLGYHGGGRGEHSGENAPVEPDDLTSELADNARNLMGGD